MNAYATVLLLGILQRLGVDSIPEALGRPEVLALVGVLFLVEFVVDKVPYIDSTWDAIHTAIRPTIAAVLGVLIADQRNDLDGVLAATTGGGTALLSHAVKAGFRLAINLSPEPITNFVVSTAEDVTVIAIVVLSLVSPWLAALFATVFLVTGLYVVWRGARWFKRRFFSRRGRAEAGRAGPVIDVEPGPRP